VASCKSAGSTRRISATLAADSSDSNHRLPRAHADRPWPRRGHRHLDGCSSL